MHPSLAILADWQPAPDTFEFARSDWWFPAVAVFALMAALAMAVIWRDCRELGARRAVLLGALRITALLGLLAMFLQPQWRAQRFATERSRALLLVDTSQSMQRHDVGAAGAPGSTKPGTGRSRTDAVVDEFTSGTLLPQLRQMHDVLIYGFDEAEQPALLATLPHQSSSKTAVTASIDAGRLQQLRHELTQSRLWLSIAGAMAVAGLVLVGVYLFRAAPLGAPSWWLVLSGGACVLIGIGITLWTVLSPTQPALLILLGLRPLVPTASVELAEAGGVAAKQSNAKPDWRELLAPRGRETRLGQAVQWLANDQRSAPVAGVIVLSDGAQNAGISIEDAAAAARDSRLAVHAVGLGSRQETALARWTSFDAHDRALPGDPFEVKARLRAVGLAGRSVTARLRQVPLDAKGAPAAADLGLDQHQEVLIGAAQEDLAIKFEVPGIKLAGRYGFELSLEGRGAAADPADARRRFEVEVVDRKIKLLLISGGPGREYRFLRNMLRRDKRVDLDTWLQSSTVAKSKDDYPRIVDHFPESIQKLQDYDCIVALDPDWGALDESQAAMLQDWVGQQAGGLIVVPGRVFAGSAVHSWLTDAKLAKIRALYPVEFPPVLFQSDDVGRKWTQVRPIDLTRDGIEADFLRLSDNPAESQRIWTSQFDGVYSTLAVRGAKTGAAVYARHIDPRAEAAGVDPVFLVEQFFGAGRVFYVGSGELWRLRQVDEGYFERFYSQLVDHVSKQRLQRGSRRGGVLLLEKNEYHVGDNIPLAADLKNVRDEPLDAAQVVLYAYLPESTQPLAVKLVRDTTRKGMYVGQLMARREGDYRLELPLTDVSDEPLVKTIKVATSARESDNPQRNDELLARLARNTGGRYYIGLDAALGRESDAPVTNLLKDRTQITPLPGDKVQGWEDMWVRLAMFGVCGALCLEWLLRRLLRLA